MPTGCHHSFWIQNDELLVSPAVGIVRAANAGPSPNPLEQPLSIFAVDLLLPWLILCFHATFIKGLSYTCNKITLLSTSCVHLLSAFLWEQISQLPGGCPPAVGIPSRMTMTSGGCHRLLALAQANCAAVKGKPPSLLGQDK